MIEELVAAQAAVVTETQNIGAAGGTADETITLRRVVSGDNGNGGTYNATVDISAVVHVTQPTAEPTPGPTTFTGTTKPTDSATTR